MPVVQLDAGQANRRQRRAHLARPHPAPARRSSFESHVWSTIEAAAEVGSPPIMHAVLLDLFGRPPVVFHRTFVDIAGGVGAALWLSHAVALTRESGVGAGATFTLSEHECAEATGMSGREQAQARWSLRDAGLLVECPHGATPSYRVDFERLAVLLLDRSAAPWLKGPSDSAITPPPPSEHATAA